jgi:hypothetical protein
MKRICRLLLVATLALVLVATSASPASAAINPSLDNATPSPNWPVYESKTVSNLTVRVLERRPAYGWNPAICLWGGTRWDGFLHGGLTYGTVTVVAFQTVDNGNCTGPRFNGEMNIQVQPYFWQPGTNNYHTYQNCVLRTSTSIGYAEGIAMTRPCSPPVDWQIGGYWMPGNYTQRLTIQYSSGRVDFYLWPHTIYQGPLWH